MKKYLYFIFTLAMFVSGCVKSEIEDKQIQPISGRVFTASFESENARTYVEEGNLLRWNAGDQISLFDSNTLNRQYQFDGETGDNAGTFSIVNAPFGTGNDLNCHYAVYPYNKDIKITETGVITANLPAEQSYAENSFGLGANTMVAVTQNVDDTFLRFRNVGGYLKLQLYGDNVTVKSITLTGNNNEKLAGKATITPAYEQAPTLAMSDDATTSITLDCGEGVKIGTTAETATAFWIVVPPTTFEEGLTITVTEIDGESFTKSTSNAVVVERNTIKPMAAFKVEIEKIHNNQIWYTSSDGDIVTPRQTSDFGVNITSNVYENGKGIITFDGNITSIGDYTFSGCTSLTSVNIPDSVTTIGDGAFYNCYSLTSVYCKATTPPSLGNTYVFDNNGSGRKIYVPIDSVEAYKNAAGWKNYANDIVGYDFEQNTNESNSCTITGSHASFTMSDSGSLYSLAKKVIDNVNTTEEWGEEIWSNIISITINGMMDARDFSTLKWNFRNLEILDISNVVVTGYTGDKGTVEGYEYYYDDNTIPLGAFFYWMSHILRPFPQELIDEGMSSLVQIKLPDGIKTIQRNAFARAYNLIDINIPDSVETIGWVSFSICTSLEHITIPENVLEIEDWAFKGCSSLNSVYCKAIYPPICGSRVFDDNASNRKIYVPMESVDSYRKSTGWSNYASDIVGYDF